MSDFVARRQAAIKAERERKFEAELRKFEAELDAEAEEAWTDLFTRVFDEHDEWLKRERVKHEKYRQAMAEKRGRGGMP
jgi:hypothetical protein